MEEVKPWMKALANTTDFFGKCDKHGEGEYGKRDERTYNLFCVQCATKASLCCQAEHAGHTLLQMKRAATQDAVTWDDATTVMDCSDIQVASINRKGVVYVGHHMSSFYAPLEWNDFIGCRQRRRDTASKAGPVGRIPAGQWTYCSIACKIAGLTRVEPRVQTAVRVRISAPLAEAAAVLAAVAGGRVAAAAGGGAVAVGSAASAMAASPTAEHLPASDASLAKPTRVMREPSIPAARRAERKTELERLASAVKDAQEERNTLVIASRGRYEDAI
jgi:hypothetical protein